MHCDAPAAGNYCVCRCTRRFILLHPLRPSLVLSAADRWLPKPIWGVGTLAASILDQPVRALSRGWLNTQTAAVESSPESYDQKRAAELWTAAAAVSGLPAELLPL